MTTPTITDPEEQLLPSDPSTWTPAERTRHKRMAGFLRALQAEGMINPACKASGVSVATQWRWREEYPAFAAAVTKFLKQTRIAQLEDNMYRIANSTDPKMAMAAVRANEFLMKSWDREQYQESVRVEGTQTVNHMVQVVHSVRDTMREEQAAKLASLQARTLTVKPSNSDALVLPDEAS